MSARKAMHKVTFIAGWHARLCDEVLRSDCNLVTRDWKKVTCKKCLKARAKR